MNPGNVVNSVNPTYSEGNSLLGLIDDEFIGVGTSTQRIQRFIEPIDYVTDDVDEMDHVFGNYDKIIDSGDAAEIFAIIPCTVKATKPTYCPLTEEPYSNYSGCYYPHTIPNQSDFSMIPTYSDDSLFTESPNSSADYSFSHFERLNSISSIDPLGSVGASSIETSASSSPLQDIENPFDFELSPANLSVIDSSDFKDGIDHYSNWSVSDFSPSQFAEPLNYQTQNDEYLQLISKNNEMQEQQDSYSQQYYDCSSPDQIEIQNVDSYRNHGDLRTEITATNNPAERDSPAHTAKLIRRNLEICELLSPFRRYREMLQKQKGKSNSTQPQFVRRKFSLMNAFSAGGNSKDRRKNVRKPSTVSDISTRPKHNVSVRRWQSEVWAKLRALTHATGNAYTNDASQQQSPRQSTDGMSPLFAQSMDKKYANRQNRIRMELSKSRATRSPPPMNVNLVLTDGDVNGPVLFQ